MTDRPDLPSGEPADGRGDPAGGRSEEVLDDLLGAYALDAVDDLERQRVERFLASDSPRAREARAELSRYEDAVAGLAGLADDVEPPSDTWAAIAATIAERPRQPAPPALPRRAAATRRWRLLALAAAAVVAVAAVAGAVAFGGGGDPSLGERFEVASGAPTSRRGALDGSAGRAEIVVAVDGTGYVAMGTLGPLPAGRVYQLWSLEGGTPASLGVLTPVDDGIATFRAPSGTTQLALSVEAAPGAASPTLPPVAVGSLT